MRLESGQRYSPLSLGDSRVLRPARHTLVCLRGRVLRDSPKPRRFRPAAAPIRAAYGIFECVRRGVPALFARSRSASGFSRAMHRRFASPGVVARACASLLRFASCHARASARLSRTEAVRVAQLAHRALPPRLARPSLSMRASCPPRPITVFSPYSLAIS